MKGAINLQFLGRFGNCLFQYCTMRAYAERHDLAFRTDPWDGEAIFDIQHERPDWDRSGLWAVKDENTLVEGDADFIYRSYSQQQKCLTYTRADVRRWLKFRPEIEHLLGHFKEIQDPLAAHLRRGDYGGYGYVLVSQKSYLNACDRYGLDPAQLRWVSEEMPTIGPCPGFPDFVPDFYRLTQAKILLRANSSFSYWAAVLGNGRVFSPVIEGMIGGETPQDVTFVEGNHPRFATFGFCTDLFLAEERAADGQIPYTFEQLRAAGKQ